MATPATILSPALREFLRGRELKVRGRVDGLRVGAHAARRAGASQEFKDYRSYVPGDDPRLLDWRAAARSERLVVRRHDSEDALTLIVLLDLGANANYGEGESRKVVVARALAMSLALLAQRQGDDVIIHCGVGRQVTTLGPRLGAVELERQLAEIQPDGKCPWMQMLELADARVGPRSVVLVISDLLDLSCEEGEDADVQLSVVMERLRDFVTRGSPCFAAQILHDDEVSFPWRDRGWLRFLDPGRMRNPIEGDADALAGGYLSRISAYLRATQALARDSHISLQRSVTTEDQLVTVARFLEMLATGVSDETQGTSWHRRLGLDAQQAADPGFGGSRRDRGETR